MSLRSGDAAELSIARAPAGRIRLTILGESFSALGKLRLLFPQAESTGKASLELSLGHFLQNIRGLGSWPSESIDWEPEVVSTVSNALGDGTHVKALMDGSIKTEPLTELTLSDASEGNWVAPLTDFQLRNVERLLAMKQGANFSVPGAGKTRTTLAVYELMKARHEVDKLVVVAPKSAHASWVEELEEVLRRQPTIEIAGKDFRGSAEVTILNYERLQALETALASRISLSSTLFVLDEAHRMKRGAQGAYGSVCLSLGPLATRRMILSGTPAPNGLEDLQALMEFVWPGRGGAIVSSRTQAGESSLSSLFVRTTKSDLDLPSMLPVIRHVELPPIHRKIYDALVGNLKTSLLASEEVDDLGRVVVYLLMAATSPALLAMGASRDEPLQYRVPPLRMPAGDRIRSLLSESPAHEMSPKIFEAVRIARQNAAQGKKTLLWSTFVRNARTLVDLLGDLNPAIVIGSSREEERRESIDRFRGDPTCMVLISNPATLGEGISLHHVCHDAVYLDRDFAAGRYLQSLDRIHRLGLSPEQQTNVTILSASNTIDDLVEQRLAEKIGFMDIVLDDPSLRELMDLEEDREFGDVMDMSDREAIWAYLRTASGS